MAAPVTPPIFPTNTQSSIPCDPDRELGSSSLRLLPTWLAGSGKSAGFQRSTFAQLIRAFQAELYPARRRIIESGISDATQWAGLDSESPYWKLEADRSTPFGDPNVYNTWASQAVANTPYIITNDFQLSTPGILVSSSSNQGYLVEIPDNLPDIETFWEGASGPAILQDQGTIYIRDIDRTVLLDQAGESLNSSSVYIPYNGDGYSINFPVTPSGTYADFDAALLPSQDGFRSVYFRRRSDGSVYNYDGVFVASRAWDIASGTFFEGVILSELRPGEVVDVSYVSQGKHALIHNNPAIIFQGDSQFGNQYGLVSGPWYPADSPGLKREVWSVPSRAFINLFPQTLRKTRLSETHADRINRLVTSQQLRGLGCDGRGVRWSLLGNLGRVTHVTVTGTISTSGEVFIPSLEGRDGGAVWFTRQDLNIESIRQSLIQGSLTTLLSTNIPLIARKPGYNYGGGSNLVLVKSRFSPFSRSSLVAKQTSNVPSATTRNWQIDSIVTGDISFSISADPTGDPTKLISYWHPFYVMEPSGTYVLPGVIADTEIRDGYSPSSDIQVKTPEAAYYRGDTLLRGPDRPTPLWSAITRLTNSRYSWSDAPSQSQPVANSAPLDMDLNLVAPSVTAPSYGQGTGIPSVTYDQPLARDFA